MILTVPKVFILITISASLASYLDLTCEFSISERFYDSEFYTCLTHNLTITSKGIQIIKILGIHLNNLSNSNVRKLSIVSSKVEYLPHEFDKFFKNIEFLDVNGVGLLELRHKDLKQFQKLKFLSATDNKLIELDEKIFNFNPQIQYINFKDNNLKYIDYRLFDRALSRRSEDSEFEFNFDGNICINGSKKFRGTFQGMHKLKNCIHENEIFCKYSVLTDCAVRDALEFLMVMKTKIVGEFDGDGHDDKNITKVSILSSNFTKIPEIFGKKFKNLENFSLRGKIRFLNFENLKYFKNLKKLNLAENQIILLKSNSFILTPNLEVLDLSSNNIFAVGKETFSILQNLEILSLKFNSLIDENFKSKNEIENSKELQKMSIYDTVDCVYSTSVFRYIGLAYYCHILNPKSPNKALLQDFYGISGQHNNNKSNNNVDGLVARFSNSTALDSNVSYYFPNLKLIRITNSNLMYLHENNFARLQNLEVLDLSANKITEVPIEIFKKNERLIYLNLSKNKIVEFNKVLEKLHNLVTFKVFENVKFNFEISRKFPDFHGQPHSENHLNLFLDKNISIYYNFFGSISNNSYFTGISINCLNYDAVQSSDKKSSCTDRNVQQITKLSAITTVTSEYNTTFITYLLIQSQIMYFIPTNISTFFPNLQILIAGNKIRKIFRANFEGLSKLEELHLAENEIEFIDDEKIFKSNRNLKKIILEGNKIKRMTKYVFISLLNLEYIDFDNNDCIIDGIYEKQKNVDDSGQNVTVCGADLPQKFANQKNYYDDLHLLGNL